VVTPWKPCWWDCWGDIIKMWSSFLTPRPYFMRVASLRFHGTFFMIYEWDVLPTRAKTVPLGGGYCTFLEDCWLIDFLWRELSKGWLLHISWGLWVDWLLLVRIEKRMSKGWLLHLSWGLSVDWLLLERVEKRMLEHLTWSSTVLRMRPTFLSCWRFIQLAETLTCPL